MEFIEFFHMGSKSESTMFGEGNGYAMRSQRLHTHIKQSVAATIQSSTHPGLLFINLSLYSSIIPYHLLFMTANDNCAYLNRLPDIVLTIA